MIDEKRGLDTHIIEECQACRGTQKVVWTVESHEVHICMDVKAHKVNGKKWVAQRNNKPEEESINIEQPTNPLPQTTQTPVKNISAR